MKTKYNYQDLRIRNDQLGTVSQMSSQLNEPVKSLCFHLRWGPKMFEN